MIHIPLARQGGSYPSIKSISPIAKNTVGDIKIIGRNFTPGTQINIAWPGTINHMIVYSDEEIIINVTSPSSTGLFDVELSNNDLSSDSWGLDHFLEVYEPLETDWIDFRETELPIITTANQTLATQTFANSGLIRNATEGLTRNATTYNNFMGFFNQFEISGNQSFKMQFILKFFSGLHVLGCGFSKILDFTRTIKESAGAIVTLENRAYSNTYFGLHPNYYSKSFVTGSNWNNSFVHCVISHKPNFNLIQLYSRASLTYDWDIPENGEFICDFTEGIVQPSDFYYPCLEIRTPNSQGFIVAMKIN